MLVAEDLLEAGVVAAFTGRAGGTSARRSPPSTSALRVGDDLRRVLANRRRVATVLGLAGQPWALARQVHGATILHIRADPPGQALQSRGPGWGRRDGSGRGRRRGSRRWGRRTGWSPPSPGVVLAVLTADCAPVLLADPAAGVVGAVHAGWRGLAAGVVEAGVAAMAELGADPGACVGLVGPAVGGCCYEVGPEVREAVGDRYPAALATTRDGRPASTRPPGPPRRWSGPGSARSGWRASAPSTSRSGSSPTAATTAAPAARPASSPSSPEAAGEPDP